MEMKSDAVSGDGTKPLRGSSKRQKERNMRGSAKGARFWKFNKLNCSTALISEYKETFRWIYYCGIHNAAKIEARGPNSALRCKNVIFARMRVELLAIYWIHYHFFFVVVAQQQANSAVFLSARHDPADVIKAQMNAWEQTCASSSQIPVSARGPRVRFPSRPSHRNTRPKQTTLLEIERQTESLAPSLF